MNKSSASIAPQGSIQAYLHRGDHRQLGGKEVEATEPVSLTVTITRIRPGHFVVIIINHHRTRQSVPPWKTTGLPAIFTFSRRGTDAVRVWDPVVVVGALIATGVPVITIGASSPPGGPNHHLHLHRHRGSSHHRHRGHTTSWGHPPSPSGGGRSTHHRGRHHHRVHHGHQGRPTRGREHHSPGPPWSPGPYHLHQVRRRSTITGPPPGIPPSPGDRGAPPPPPGGGHHQTRHRHHQEEEEEHHRRRHRGVSAAVTRRRRRRSTATATEVVEEEEHRSGCQLRPQMELTRKERAISPTLTKVMHCYFVPHSKPSQVRRRIR